MRLSKEEIRTIWDAYEQHRLLRAVHRTLPHSLSTIHKYVGQKYKINKQPRVHKLQSHDERLIGTYVGLWMGDGTQYMDRHQYTVKLCSDARSTRLNEFLEGVVWKLFGKKTNRCVSANTNELYVRFVSKFIFEFIFQYVQYSQSKTHSVQLKERIQYYSDEFLCGVVLGLMLSDGYLKRRCVFRTVSSGLALNMYDMMQYFGFHPRMTRRIRQNPAHAPIFSVYLTYVESQVFEDFMNEVILLLGHDRSFWVLKYGE